MRVCLCLLALLTVGGALARADEPWLLFDGCHWAFPKLCYQWRLRCGWCPDDYCGKPLPHVPPNPNGCVDDYCRKSLPHVPPNPKGCVDDYCGKSCPLFLGSLMEPWYTCGTPHVGGVQPCPNGPSKP